MKKLIIFLLLVIFILSIIPNNVESIPSCYLCSWWQNWCWTRVTQCDFLIWPIGWYMEISCWFPENDGRWSGWGEWTGVCSGGWVGPILKELI